MSAPWIYTERQDFAIDQISQSIALHCLLYGGSGSGKTALICMLIIKRALKCKSRHAIARRSKTECIKLIGKKTLPECFEALGMVEDEDWDYVNDIVTIFKTGSEIHILGMDTKDGQYKKVLGDEYSTLYFNESNDIAYVAAEYGISRMRQQNILKKRIFYDCNPPSKSHWLYKLFFLNVDPVDQAKKDADNYLAIQLNPYSNIDNLDESYIKQLESMSPARRKKFFEGEFGEIAIGKVFNSTDINMHKIMFDEMPALDVVVVSVDPNISSKKGSDDCGIIIGGKCYDSDEYYVYFDGTVEGAGPGVWPGRVCQLFKGNMANYVLAEVNQGGELVTMAIKGYVSSDGSVTGKNVPVKTVHAKIGKAARAEPIAEIYAQGRVHHVDGLSALEDEMTEWDPETTPESPNRIDALVQLITKLSEGSDKFICVTDEDVAKFEAEEKKEARILVDATIKTYSVLEMCSDDNPGLWN